jgi:hypothetical protein
MGSRNDSMKVVIAFELPLLRMSSLREAEAMAVLLSTTNSMPSVLISATLVTAIFGDTISIYIMYTFGQGMNWKGGW